MTFETEVLWLDDQQVVSLGEMARFSGLSELELRELVQAGAIPLHAAAGDTYTFSARVVTVARQASRLRDDLELDTHGMGVALRLLARVRDLEREIARLRVLLPRR
jgi:chaperone modulatory protein CbpM